MDETTINDKCYRPLSICTILVLVACKSNWKLGLEDFLCPLLPGKKVHHIIF